MPANRAPTTPAHAATTITINGTEDGPTARDNAGYVPEAGFRTVGNDVVLIVDRSGSMNGQPLEEALRCVKHIASHLTPQDALALVGLADRMNHFVSQLSGGEQQRVAIARAIAKRPQVLLCDEPTGALDCATGIVVLQAIEKVNRELGTTTVVITHNAPIAAMADRVMRMADGRIVDIHVNADKVAASTLRW